MEKIVPAVVMFLSAFLLPGYLIAGQPPVCLQPDNSSTVESMIEQCGIPEQEVLARLVYAEGISTGYADEPTVYEAIAWGVMNRVRLSEACPSKHVIYGRGIRGVAFKKGQFNPAVSRKSQFSREFLCPSNPAQWRMAEQAARKARAGEGNPFIQTPWEKKYGLSLVVGFYYPQSVQAKSPFAPWEKSKALKFIGDVRIGGEVLPAHKIRFYRLTSPPVDIMTTCPKDEQKPAP